MPIICIEIIKTIGETEPQKQNKNKQKKQTLKRTKGGGRSYSERVRAKWLCCAFKLGFLQLICKASLIFELNLELAVSIILKQRELQESEHVVMECRCLEIWDLLPVLICSTILVLKWWQALPYS